MATSLWGEEFEIPNEQETVKKIIKKVKVDNRTDEQKLKSKKTSIEDKIEIITQNVYKVLGHYKDIVTVIKSREELHNYIDAAIQNGIIAIDTETNNSLDPLTCLLMGGCIYTPGQNAAYIPINHVNRETNERLSWQCTEKDIKEEFDRLNEANVKILTHNGKFDYKVLLCTCNYDMPIYWDSYVAARLLDENEPSAGLKQQYISKIDPTQEKYSIDHLFEELPYAIFDPELFAYYAAIDAYMTYKLYLWQVERFKDPNLTGVKNIFDTIEMPLIKVVAKMELTGIDIDLNYAERLSKKYHKLLDDCNTEVQAELSKYEEQILQWRLTPEANFKPKKKKITKTGEEFDKSKNEQLEDPVNVSSPTQLAILLYDILKVPQVSTKQPRGTGVEELKAIHNKTQLPICNLILRSRTLEKLINTFIDKLPNDKNSKDGKIHCEFMSLGTDCITGDSSILTPNGVEFMEDIVGECIDKEYKEFKYTLINENGVPETTSHKIMFKDVPTYKIKTIYGFEIEGTSNHPIRVSGKNLKDLPYYKRVKNPKIIDSIWEDYRWEKLENIKQNDLVFISTNKIKHTQDYIRTEFDQNIQNLTHKKSTRMPEYFDENFAELLGMYHADGSLNNTAGSCALRLHNEQPEVVERWKYLCDQCFDMVPVYENQGPKSQGIISSWYINGKKLNQLYTFLVTGQKKKRIPKEILKSRDSVFNAYIKGLTLDSNTRAPYNDCLQIFLINKQDAQAIQLRFLSQGILTSVNASIGLKNRIDGYYVKFKYKPLKWFYENVGVIQSSKIIENIEEINPPQFYEKDGLIALPVKKITQNTNTVYDFTLPETHSFIANGFISHNTGRFSSKNPNLQNIPRSDISIKPMFRAPKASEIVKEFDTSITLNMYDEVETQQGWVKAKELKVQDSLLLEDGVIGKIVNIICTNNKIQLEVNCA